VRRVLWRREGYEREATRLVGVLVADDLQRSRRTTASPTEGMDTTQSDWLGVIPTDDSKQIKPLARCQHIKHTKIAAAERSHSNCKAHMNQTE
jgi:hypothetical protein